MLRLLEVEAGPTNAPRSDRIRISILTIFFDPNVTLVYHAVTVDTGDGEEPMTLRRNCADVLRQLAMQSEIGAVLR
jgi:hypothetical protein